MLDHPFPFGISQSNQLDAGVLDCGQGHEFVGREFGIADNDDVEGVGEVAGVSVAHGLQAGFYAMPDAKPMMHGTGVGYGALVQLVLQKDARLPEVYSLCKDVGIPVCTADLGLTPENRDRNIQLLIDEVYENRWNIHNVPFKVTRQMLMDAIDELDTYSEKQ
mgnify:CR=1 FL=1